MSTPPAQPPVVGIVMGSDSDWPVMRAAAEALEEFDVPYEADVVSAHRMPRDMIEYGSSAAGRGLRVIIAGAGGAAHLPGMLASVTPLPVIGVPVPLASLSGLDSLLSIVQMPAGIPVATVAIGGARNAGLLAVRILAAGEGPAAGELRGRLTAFARQLADQAQAKGAALRDRRQSGLRCFRSGQIRAWAPSATADTVRGSKEADVSIGATLAAARRHAGLSVGDVSQRTRVRENIIESIEQDDYAACGGDFYARGHIRAIAQAVGADPAPLIEEFDATWRSTREITAAEAFQPSMPLRVRERRRVRGAAVLGVLVLAVLGFASYKFVAGAARTQRTAAVSTLHPPPRHPASAPAGGASVQASGSPSASASPSPTPSATPTPQALTPASVTAFGSGGAGDGDNPGQASLALSGNSATPWTSDWYATAQFGNLQSGTGLLVDMGQTVTINSVQLSLGDTSGADLQLLAGGTPVMSDLQTVATSSNAGGTVQLSLSSPAHARYLLIWFTQLPADNAGTYQASIYNIAVKGQR